MRIKTLSASLLALSCVIFTASCLQSPTAAGGGGAAGGASVGIEPAALRDEGDPIVRDPDTGGALERMEAMFEEQHLGCGAKVKRWLQ
jgi:hypothetical protein